MSQANGLEEWFKTIPPISRAWLVASLGSTFAVVLGFTNPVSLYLDWDLIIKKFQIWRVVTAFTFFGKPGLPFLFQLYIMYKNSTAYERNPFALGLHPQGTSADYAFLIIFGISFLSLIALVMEIPFLGPALVFMVLYVWSRRNPTQPMSIYGFQFQGINYPWILLALSVLLGNPIIFDLLGIAVGHLFYFWVDIAPNTYPNMPQWLMLRTPEFLFNIFDGAPAYVPGARTASGPRSGGFGGSHSWGSRRTLGSQG